MTFTAQRTLITALLTTTLTLPALAHDDIVADGSKADNKHLLHDTPLPDGHVPANVNYGFTVIGRDTLGGIEDGLYTDVWAHKGSPMWVPFRSRPATAPGYTYPIFATRQTRPRWA